MQSLEIERDRCCRDNPGNWETKPRTRDDGSGLNGTGDETEVPLVTPLPVTSPGYHSQGNGEPDPSTRTYINHGSAMVG